MKLLYIDLFCGAGGTSTGIENAVVNGHKCAQVIACVNHDPNAIASHAANHHNAIHYTEDIRTLDISKLVEQAQKQRILHNDAKIVLWASLECTNFSKAKGGLPRDADSRTLAEHLFRYIDGLNPDYIQIENVEEFMSWGEVDEFGKPVSKDKGKSYLAWVQNVRKRGYDFQYRILNAADYGAYTCRKRFFGIFAKSDLPIVFPEPTHCKRSKNNGLFPLKPWNPVKDVLDFTDPGTSIFNRKKPLCEATLERIYAGLIKFVAGGEDSFIVKYNSMNQRRKYVSPGINEPCPTIATQQRLGLARVQFLSKYFSGAPKGKNVSVEEPAGAVTTKDHHSFITAYYGNGGNHSIEEPSPTITTKDRLAFIDMKYSHGTPTSLNEPAGTITTTPKHNLISCTPLSFLMNPQYHSAGGAVDSPCFTLIARMDKRPPYLISAHHGSADTKVEGECGIMRKIIEFMKLYNIVDIKMRMLRIDELKRIMGFPDNYILIGTQQEQKKYIGNAVEVNMSRCLCEALYQSLN